MENYRDFNVIEKLFHIISLGYIFVIYATGQRNISLLFQMVRKSCWSMEKQKRKIGRVSSVYFGGD